jgi:hypothetical protein
VRINTGLEECRKYTLRFLLNLGISAHYGMAPELLL